MKKTQIINLLLTDLKEEAFKQYGAPLGEIEVLIEFIRLALIGNDIDYFFSDLFAYHCDLLRTNHFVAKSRAVKLILCELKCIYRQYLELIWEHS